MLKCSPVLEMWHPKLRNCTSLGSYREMLTILYLFSSGCRFTVSLPKTVLLPAMLPYPTYPTGWSSPFPEGGSKPLWNWNLQHYFRLLLLLFILKGVFFVLLCFLIDSSRLQFGINILLQNSVCGCGIWKHMVSCPRIEPYYKKYTVTRFLL